MSDAKTLAAEEIEEYARSFLREEIARLTEELDRYRKVAEAAVEYRRSEPLTEWTVARQTLDDSLTDVGMKVGE
jgi:hypothetical protein